MNTLFAYNLSRSLARSEGLQDGSRIDESRLELGIACRVSMFPRSLLGRTLLVLWLTACLAVLAYEFVQRNTPEADIVSGILLLFLTFPVGHALGAVIGVVFRFLHGTYGIIVPGGFIPNLILWPFFVAVGYFLWFVVVPWLFID